MRELEILEAKGTEAVKRLRMEKLKKGLPFMINSKELPSNQCYMEYPHGSIKLATFSKGSKDFIIIRELNLIEADTLRKKYKFYPIVNV